jgi:sugar lactone lactonase YvrE
MARLHTETGLTVTLGVLDGDDVVIIDRLDAARQGRLTFGIGQHVPLHATALGKAILAITPPSDRSVRLERLKLAPVTPHTITDAAEFAQHLDLVTVRRYAVEEQENLQGVNGCAAAILDHEGLPVGALSVLGTAVDLVSERLHQLGPDLLEAATRCSRSLGFMPPPIGHELSPPDHEGGDMSCVLPATAFTGANPVWCAENRLLWWIDVQAPAIHCFDPARSMNRTWPTRSIVGAIGLAGPDRLIVALQSGFHSFQPSTGQLTFIAHPEVDMPRHRFNKGRCDRQGRFWSSTMDMGLGPDRGALYRLDPDGSVHCLDRGLTVPNGMDWSPDGRRFYLTDSAHHTIFVYDCDPASGQVAGRRVFARIPETSGRPTGLSVDAEGHVYSALTDGWCVTRFDPDGAVERVLPVPVPKPNGCCFGGLDLRTLYVTTARIRMSTRRLNEAPLSGSIFACAVPCPGQPETNFGS